MQTSNHALSALRSLMGRRSKIEDTRFRHSAAIEAFLTRLCAPNEPAAGWLRRISRLGDRIVCKINRVRRF